MRERLSDHRMPRIRFFNYFAMVCIAVSIPLFKEWWIDKYEMILASPIPLWVIVTVIVLALLRDVLYFFQIRQLAECVEIDDGYLYVQLRGPHKYIKTPLKNVLKVRRAFWGVGVVGHPTPLRVYWVTLKVPNKRRLKFVFAEAYDSKRAIFFGRGAREEILDRVKFAKQEAHEPLKRGLHRW